MPRREPVMRAFFPSSSFKLSLQCNWEPVAFFRAYMCAVTDRSDSDRAFLALSVSEKAVSDIGQLRAPKLP